MPGIAPTVGTGSRSLLSAGCGHVALDVPLRNGFACGPPLAAWAIPCCLDAGKPSRSSVSPVCWCCEFSSEQLEMVFACCAEVFWSGSGKVGPDLAAGSVWTQGSPQGPPCRRSAGAASSLLSSWRWCSPAALRSSGPALGRWGPTLQRGAAPCPACSPLPGTPPARSRCGCSGGSQSALCGGWAGAASSAGGGCMVAPTACLALLRCVLMVRKS